ncbi:DNA recombination protein RmuC [Sedimentibacter sp. zth1]|nr:DNA recombination protein RmuC [Sedimentibacter sp. zth1]
MTTITCLISIFILIRLVNSSNQRNNKMMTDLKIMITENNNTALDNILSKISDSNQRQLKMLLENKLETVEKLEYNSSRMNRDFLSFQENTSKYINESNIKLTESLSNNFNTLNNKVDENLDKINKRVEERLNEGFEKTNKTFNNILERLSKIDEAQKKIDSLSTNIVSLQDILTDKKSRGTFGEIQLNNILYAIFGEKNDKTYQIQKKLSNGTIVDAMLFIPQPVGNLSIDSKFPLENYQRMIDKSLTAFERAQAEKDFKLNIKKHINDISSKYIIKDETSEQAVMFIPAEAIFAEINAYHQDLVDYAGNKKVWLASPTTLMSVLSTVQVILKNMERERYSSIIHTELNKLGEEFKRYKTRWDSLAKNIKKVSNDVDNINITSNKIEKKFNSISMVEIDTDIENVDAIVDLDLNN